MATAPNIPDNMFVQASVDGQIDMGRLCIFPLVEHPPVLLSQVESPAPLGSSSDGRGFSPAFYGRLLRDKVLSGAHEIRGIERPRGKTRL
jgi:hypothetical protein